MFMAELGSAVQSKRSRLVITHTCRLFTTSRIKSPYGDKRDHLLPNKPFFSPLNVTLSKIEHRKLTVKYLCDERLGPRTFVRIFTNPRDVRHFAQSPTTRIPCRATVPFFTQALKMKSSSLKRSDAVFESASSFSNSILMYLLGK